MLVFPTRLDTLSCKKPHRLFAHTLALQGQDLFVGGDFVEAGGKASIRIARWAISDEVIPLLTIQLFPEYVVLKWPVAESNWTLESASHLSENQWQPEPSAVADGVNQATNILNSEMRYFRLKLGARLERPAHFASARPPPSADPPGAGSRFPHRPRSAAEPRARDHRLSEIQKVAPEIRCTCARYFLERCEQDPTSSGISATRVLDDVLDREALITGVINDPKCGLGSNNQIQERTARAKCYKPWEGTVRPAAN